MAANGHPPDFARFQTLTEDALREEARALFPKPLQVLIPAFDRVQLMDQLSVVLSTAVPDKSNGQANGANDKKKRRKKKKRASATESKKSQSSSKSFGGDEELEGVEIEYVPETIEDVLAQSDYRISSTFLEQFSKTFEKFAFGGAAEETDGGGDNEGAVGADGENAGGDDGNAGQAEGEENADGDEPKMSKKKQRRMNRLSVAELKQLVKKPEVVEWVDVTAADPKMLVHLKAYRNTVPIPIHWQQKRKYLQGKRGIEKPPFELPDFIKTTGIMEMRNAVKEKEDSQKLKSKTRERMQPKMGKLDIDYQKLHDAFFRWQTKPKLSIHGDMYYEGKEFETKLKLKKPGSLSEDLKVALNIPHLAPPPWLINMQRYGPPPSYPNLKIPGLNAPIPDGAQWGYHPGGWGKPPVDEYNRPLYGDVFGTYTVHVVASEYVTPIERKLWGELESDEEEEEEEEEDAGGEEQEEEEEAEETPDGLESGLTTPSGLASVPSGLETPEFVELRKDLYRGDEPKQLYTVIPEKAPPSARGAFMGSQHVYDLSKAGGTSAAIPNLMASSSGSGKRKHTGQDVEVALNPEDLEDGLDSEVVRKRYEQGAQDRASGKEDLSDIMAEEMARRNKKRKKDDAAKKDGKDKKFRF
ncbi:DUF382-domain-containing protein [Cladochytrium replicatum]|nr:DUF382-domain-containing protein [Cladochytrium replicatum]